MSSDAIWRPFASFVIFVGAAGASSGTLGTSCTPGKASYSGGTEEVSPRNHDSIPPEGGFVTIAEVADLF